ncbi:MAG: DUF4922 domain-containing protein [Candidatus Omnitrophica bacterium]|nr:DUF4922 domain-containing protein [Candidatus Omnitrophota bacterium]
MNPGKWFARLVSFVISISLTLPPSAGVYPVFGRRALPSPELRQAGLRDLETVESPPKLSGLEESLQAGLEEGRYLSDDLRESQALRDEALAGGAAPREILDRVLEPFHPSRLPRPPEGFIQPGTPFILSPLKHREVSEKVYPLQAVSRKLVELSTDDPRKRDLANRLLEALSARLQGQISPGIPLRGEDLPFPQAAAIHYELIRVATGEPDPYKTLKKQDNEIALGLLPKLEELIRSSQNPLLASLQAGIIGNALDQGPAPSRDLTVLLGVTEERLREASSQGSSWFFRSDFSPLRDKLSRQNQKVLFLMDNAGEAVLDLLFIKQMLAQGHSVTLVGRGRPVVNDVTKQDIEGLLGRLEIDRFFREIPDWRSRLAVISSGSDIAGTDLRWATPEFTEAWLGADLRIAKGQGTWENLRYNALTKDVFFLLQVKKPELIRNEFPEGAHLLVYGGLEELPPSVVSRVREWAEGQNHPYQENLRLLNEILNSGLLQEDDPLPRGTVSNLGDVLLAIQRHQRMAPRALPPLKDPQAAEGHPPRLFPGTSLRVQFRPARDTSGMSYLEGSFADHRRCTLCQDTVAVNFPGLKAYRWRGFNIWPNPFPVFQDHITLAWKDHRDQQINLSEIQDVIDLLLLAPAYRVFHNGLEVGVSVPKHQHFQGITDRLPVEDASLEKVGDLRSVSVFAAKGYPAQVLVLEGSLRDDLADAGNRFLRLLDGRIARREMLGYNVLFARGPKEGAARIFIFPRVSYASSWAKERHLDGIGIASIEMGGVIITGNEKTYQAMKTDDAQKMLREVSVTPEQLRDFAREFLSGLEEGKRYRVDGWIPLLEYVHAKATEMSLRVAAAAPPAPNSDHEQAAISAWDWLTHIRQEKEILDQQSAQEVFEFLSTHWVWYKKASEGQQVTPRHIPKAALLKPPAPVAKPAAPPQPPSPSVEIPQVKVEIVEQKPWFPLLPVERKLRLHIGDIVIDSRRPKDFVAGINGLKKEGVELRSGWVMEARKGRGIRNAQGELSLGGLLGDHFLTLRMEKDEDDFRLQKERSTFRWKNLVNPDPKNKVTRDQLVRKLSRVLIRHAPTPSPPSGLEEQEEGSGSAPWDERVKELIGDLVAEKDANRRLDLTERRLPTFDESQRAAFLKALFWVREHPEVQAWLVDIFLAGTPQAELLRDAILHAVLSSSQEEHSDEALSSLALAVRDLPVQDGIRVHAAVKAALRLSGGVPWKAHGQLLLAYLLDGVKESQIRELEAKRGPIEPSHYLKIEALYQERVRIWSGLGDLYDGVVSALRNDSYVARLRAQIMETILAAEEGRLKKEELQEKVQRAIETIAEVVRYCTEVQQSLTEALEGDLASFARFRKLEKLIEIHGVAGEVLSMGRTSETAMAMRHHAGERAAAANRLYVLSRGLQYGLGVLPFELYANAMVDAETQSLLREIRTVKEPNQRMKKTSEELSQAASFQRVLFLEGLSWMVDDPEIQRFVSEVFLGKDPPAESVRAILLDDLLLSMMHDGTDRLLWAFGRMVGRLPNEQALQILDQTERLQGEGGPLAVIRMLLAIYVRDAIEQARIPKLQQEAQVSHTGVTPQNIKASEALQRIFLTRAENWKRFTSHPEVLRESPSVQMMGQMAAGVLETLGRMRLARAAEEGGAVPSGAIRLPDRQALIQSYTYYREAFLKELFSKTHPLVVALLLEKLIELEESYAVFMGDTASLARYAAGHGREALAYRRMLTELVTKMREAFEVSPQRDEQVVTGRASLSGAYFSERAMRTGRAFHGRLRQADQAWLEYVKTHHPKFSQACRRAVQEGIREAALVRRWYLQHGIESLGISPQLLAVLFQAASEGFTEEEKGSLRETREWVLAALFPGDEAGTVQRRALANGLIDSEPRPLGLAAYAEMNLPAIEEAWKEGQPSEAEQGRLIQELAVKSRQFLTADGMGSRRKRLGPGEAAWSVWVANALPVDRMAAAYGREIARILQADKGKAADWFAGAMEMLLFVRSGAFQEEKTLRGPYGLPIIFPWLLAKMRVFAEGREIGEKEFSAEQRANQLERIISSVRAEMLRAPERGDTEVQEGSLGDLTGSALGGLAYAAGFKMAVREGSPSQERALAAAVEYLNQAVSDRTSASLGEAIRRADAHFQLGGTAADTKPSPPAELPIQAGDRVHDRRLREWVVEEVDVQGKRARLQGMSGWVALSFLEKMPPLSSPPKNQGPPSAGLEEFVVGDPKSDPSGIGAIRSVTLRTGTQQASGQVFLVDSRQVQVVSWFNPEILDQDLPGDTLPQMLGDPALSDDQLPGRHFQEIIEEGRGSAEEEQAPRLIYASNSFQSNFWQPLGLLIVDGRLIRKTDKKRGLFQSEYRPLDGRFTVFVLAPLERLGLETVEIKNNQLVTGGISHAISGPALLRNGELVADQIEEAEVIKRDERGRPLGLDWRPDRVGWNPKTTQASFSAIGIDPAGKLIFLSMFGERMGERLSGVTVHQLASLLKELGARDALLLGGSQDVNQWDGTNLRSSPRRPQPAGGKGVERPFRPLNAALLVYPLIGYESGLEEKPVGVQAPVAEPVTKPMRFVVDTGKGDARVLELLRLAVQLRLGEQELPIRAAGVATAQELAQAQARLSDPLARRLLEAVTYVYLPGDEADHRRALNEAMARVQLPSPDFVIREVDQNWIEWYLAALKELGVRGLTPERILEEIEPLRTAA